MLKWLQLPGPSSVLNSKPQHCAACEHKELYQQNDFRRDVGLWVLGVATVITVVLAYYRSNWWLTWSPFFVFLVIDRWLARSSSMVVICYKCGHIHRGLDRPTALEFPAFDLETYDRTHYSNAE
jgi:hypothetical protein